MNLVFLILMLGLPSDGDQEWYSVIDVDVRSLAYHTSNNSRMLFTQYGKTELILFDFETEMVKTIQDGRFKAVLGEPFSYKEGFGILGHLTKTIVFIDRNGEYLSTLRCSELEGWETDFKIASGFTGPNNSFMVNLRLPDMSILVAEIKIESRKIEILHARNPTDDFIHRYLFAGDKWYFLTEETGEISLLDSDTFKKTKVIRRGRKALKRKARRGRSPYFGLLDPPGQAGDMLSFKCRKYRDPSGAPLDEVQVSGILLDGETLKEEPFYTYGVYGEKRLVLDLEEREFMVLHKK